MRDKKQNWETRREMGKKLGDGTQDEKKWEMGDKTGDKKNGDTRRETEKMERQDMSKKKMGR